MLLCLTYACNTFLFLYICRNWRMYFARFFVHLSDYMAANSTTVWLRNNKDK